jgi:N-formylmaleamate deformylase
MGATSIDQQINSKAGLQLGTKREDQVLSTNPRGSSAYITVNGLRIHYLEYGQGEVDLVVIPGITSPAITWEFVAEKLSRDYHVYVMDVRGRGLSDKPPSGYDLSDYAADTAGLIRALNLDRPVVLGHSMGARITAALGTLFQGLPGSTILADPPLSGPGRAPYPIPLVSFVNSLREAQAGATAEDMRRYFPTWTEEQLRLRAEWLATCDETAIVETYRNFHEEDFFPYWERLRAPILFVYGEESPVVPETAIEEIRAVNPQAEIVSISKAGHMIPWDNLPEFVDEVRRFINVVEHASVGLDR